MVSTIGAFIIGTSFVFFLVNFWVSWRKPVPAGDNPWDGHALEWFTTSPPPHHNYTQLPPIRSERPTWDYNHPGSSDALPTSISSARSPRQQKQKEKETAGVGS